MGHPAPGEARAAACALNKRAASLPYGAARLGRTVSGRLDIVDVVGAVPKSMVHAKAR